MRNMCSLLAAACVGTGAMVLSLPVAAESALKTEVTAVKSDMKMDISLPEGITAKDLNADKAIEKSFKRVTEDGLSKSGFDNLVGCLADQDKDRITKSTDKSLTNLDGNNNKQLQDIIGSLDTRWNSKYNQKFSMDFTKVFTQDFLHIVTGEVSDPSLLVGKWPLTASAMGAEQSGKLTPSDADTAKSKYFGGEVNLEKGRTVAIAHLKASGGLPGITASLIHEHLSGWRFDIPNNIDAMTLYNNLVNNLSYLDSHKDLWPADVNDGYREFSHAVVSALYGVDLQKVAVNKTAGER